jgi:hypothetical protein
VPDPDEPLAQLVEEPVFVVGAARSGTTWVHDVLRAHPQVAGVFESMLFEPLNGVGGLLGRAHWSDPPRGVARLADRAEVVADVRRLASDVLGHALQPHHRYLVEKTPSHVHVMREIAEVFPDSRFVHVVRDGRDVCVSWRFARRTWARGWHRAPAGLEVARIARRWQRAVRRGREQAAELGDRVLEVRYEELRADPFPWYRTLFEFCRIPCDDELLSAVHGRTDFDTSGRAEKGGGFYRSGRVGDWRRSFNLVDGLVFNAVAGQGLVEAGYESDRLWLAPLRRAEPLPRA